MKLLQNKVNVIAPTATYPYGASKDDSGSNDGTPVDFERFNDWDQWFERMMSFSGITANGLPDNDANTFQLFEALFSIIPKKFVWAGLTTLDGDVINISRTELESGRANIGSNAIKTIHKGLPFGGATENNFVDLTFEVWLENGVGSGNWQALNGATGSPGSSELEIDGSTGDITITVHGAPASPALPIRVIITG